jgi:hypothetical protein
MPNGHKTLSRSLSHELVEVLQAEFGGDHRAVELFARFWESTGYSRQFALHLVEVARGNQADSWGVRRLATLILQVYLLRLEDDNTQEFVFILEQLRLKEDCGTNDKVPDSVLREGYSSPDLRRFLVEFRRRLSRPRWVLKTRKKKPFAGDDVRAFVRLSRQDCKLALGRCLFTPEEVVARIHQQVAVAEGMDVAIDDRLVVTEMQRAMASLPPYEASILQLLTSGRNVYWVADDTAATLNSLVEYPLGTVVLTVKPPGSHVEFELKRAGRRGDHPLSAVLERDGEPVAPSHRLDGGSMVSALQWEMTVTSIFGHVYRHVHDEEAPISRIVRLTSKYKVPLRSGQHRTLDYFNNPGIYGEGYGKMREAMAGVVEAFRSERGNAIQPIPGELGLTVQFIAQVAPVQAILCGSSSFRLDRLAKYLSQDGPAHYFASGRLDDYTNFDAKMLADDVLDEVLGVYDPPDVPYRNHQQYIEAALAIPQNRARADATYRTLLDQIGTMWGTLLAMRGYSFGESFVARNVGLRTIWSGGNWHVRLVFQDHDNLVVPCWDQSAFWPLTALPATILDESYLVGARDPESLDRALVCLRRIYRIGDARRAQEAKALRIAMKRAYVKTQRAMKSDPEVRDRFHKRFVERLDDWDAVVRKYLARNASKNGEAWKYRVERFLEKRGYDEESIANHCHALEKHGAFLERYSLLYRAKMKTSRVPS